jgi:two-component system, OmpR family, phosphate regulon sensor histidine kinase PhoR
MTTETEQLFNMIFACSADGLLLSSAEGKVQRCNPAMATLIGKPENEITGRNIREFIDLESLVETENGNGDENSPKNCTVYCANGMGLIVPMAHLPVPDSKPNPAGERAHLTIVYIVQAHSVQQAQTEFVSTVSHELRTPLTSIKGFADTIIRAGDRLDASQQRRYIGIIKDQADRLTRLVEDLLAVSRLESRKMQLTIRALQLDDAVYRVCQNLADKSARHQISIKIPPGLPPVWADADRLEQILTNLIDNAIKYSPTGTTVTVTARALSQKPEVVEFSVNDQGAGISEDYLPQIFNKFSRHDNPLTRQTEGTGLGLYITKSLILALDGNVTVTSSPGSTTFTVQIPAATPEQQAARGLGLA